MRARVPGNQMFGVCAFASAEFVVKEFWTRFWPSKVKTGCDRPSRTFALACPGQLWRDFWKIGDGRGELGLFAILIMPVHDPYVRSREGNDSSGVGHWSWKPHEHPGAESLHEKLASLG